MTLYQSVVSVSRDRTVPLLAGVLALSGCAVIGPSAISNGRGVYTEVINRTEDEQILNVIVRERYDETTGMMSVASVTASLRFRANAGAEFGIGSDESFAGNLVPLSAGVAYEENPTISYVPLSGEDFTQRLLSPISPREWILLSAPAEHSGRVLAAAVHRINDLRNPRLGEDQIAPDFARFAELYDQLRRANVLDLAQTDKSTSEATYYWDIHDYSDGHIDSVREFLELLGIEKQADGSMILLPIRAAVGSSTSAVHVQPRSAYDVLRVFGVGIEVPEDHLEAGIVEPLRTPVPDKERFITIRSSEKRPDNATVRVRYRDRWFYIDATDTRSKRAFKFIRTLIGMRLADPGASQRAPVVTIPAG